MKYSELIGKRIRIIEMQGEPDYAGKEGVAKHIDDIEQVHGTWGGCAIIPIVDKFEILEDDKDERSN